MPWLQQLLKLVCIIESPQLSSIHYIQQNKKQKMFLKADDAHYLTHEVHLHLLPHVMFK